MMDRFRDAQWYIGGGDALNTIIYDAGDLEGDGPDGHGMVCQDAVLYDARLIAAAPALLKIVEFLGEWVEGGADVVHLGALFGDDDWSLADAVISTIQKINEEV